MQNKERRSCTGYKKMKIFISLIKYDDYMMRKFHKKLYFIFVFIFFLSIFQTSAVASDTSQIVPSELFVCFRPEIAGNETEFEIVASSLHAHFNATVLKNSSRLGIPGLQLIHLGDNVTIQEAVSWYSDQPSVLYAEPNCLIPIPEPIPALEAEGGDLTVEPSPGESRVSALSALFPNDPLFPEQWNMNKIQMPSAWDLSTGSGTVVIAVADMGVNYNLPDLKSNIWTNQGEIPGNGIDDDHNGFTDDVYGWDFFDNDNVPLDTYGHGTEIASIIGAKGNNQEGIAGILWNVRIMPIRCGNERGISVSDFIEGVTYAKNNGARIITCSFGNEVYKNTEKYAIENAPDILFVCAAGNDGKNVDITPHYPSGYPCPNIISVAATDSNDYLCRFSNYGRNSVHVAAPAEDILTQSHDSKFSYVSGTSYAVPHVAGLAGLILSLDPSKKPAEIRQLIVNSVDRPGSLTGYVSSGGRINVSKTLEATISSKKYLIRATASPGGSIHPSGVIEALFGSSQIFTISPDPGYKVDDVVIDGIHYGSLSIFTFNDIKSDHSITVSFSPRPVSTFTITASATGGGTIDPSGQIQVSAGSSQTFRITPSSGYRIADVMVNGKSMGPITTYTFQNVQANQTISARFEVTQTGGKTLNVTLEKGWNFISVPDRLVDGQDTADSVFRDVATDGRLTFTYDASAARWQIVTGDSRIEPYRGIWIYSSNPTEVHFPLREKENETPISLYQGWNAIGCPGTIPIPARDAFSSIQNSWSMAIGFDAHQQQYENVLIKGGSGSHSDGNALFPGKGYWIYVTNPCTFP
jgi:subtilisin family serine protease